MRKLDFCLCENKGADQLCSNCTADQHLCFRYTDSTIPLLPISEKFTLLAIFHSCTGRFLSDLVGTPEDRFSRVTAQIWPKSSLEILFRSSITPCKFNAIHFHQTKILLILNSNTPHLYSQWLKNVLYCATISLGE